MRDFLVNKQEPNHRPNNKKINDEKNCDTRRDREFS
jgi:hypothetical protein